MKVKILNSIIPKIINDNIINELISHPWRIAQDNIENVYYHFQDWFDGAKRKVDETSPIYRYAIHMLEEIK